jgi:hypothetical protein
MGGLSEPALPQSRIQAFEQKVTKETKGEPISEASFSLLPSVQSIEAGRKPYGFRHGTSPDSPGEYRKPHGPRYGDTDETLTRSATAGG